MRPCSQRGPVSSKPQAALRLLEILKKLALQRLETLADAPLSPRQDPCSESPSATPAPSALLHRLPITDHHAGAAYSMKEPCFGPWSPRASTAKALCKESHHYVSQNGAVAGEAIPCRQGHIRSASVLPAVGTTFQRSPPASLREDVSHHSPKGHVGPPTLSHTGALCPLETDPGLGHCPQLLQPRGRRRGHGYVPTQKR